MFHVSFYQFTRSTGNSLERKARMFHETRERKHQSGYRFEIELLCPPRIWRKKVILTSFWIRKKYFVENSVKCFCVTKNILREKKGLHLVKYNITVEGNSIWQRYEACRDILLKHPSGFSYFINLTTNN